MNIKTMIWLALGIGLAHAAEPVLPDAERLVEPAGKNAAAVFQTASAPSIATWQNADGSTVSLVSRRELPIANIQVSFKNAGSSFEPKTDVAETTASLLATGTRSMDEEALRDESNRLGISLSGSAGADDASVGLSTLSRPDTLPAALKLLNQVITQPAFDEAVLRRETAQSISALKQQESSPNFIASRALTQLNYGAHPYANGAKTDAASLSALTRSDLQQFHRSRFAKSNAHIAIVGDIGREQAERISRELLEGLPDTPSENPHLPEVPAAKGRTQHIPFAGKEQAVVMMSLPLMVRRDPDRYALAVGNYILGGGGFDSRLMKTLRDKQGLVYGVSSSLSQRRRAAPFVIRFSTRKDKAHTALAAARRVLADFIAKGPTEAELQQAKDYLTGSFPLRFDTNAKLLPYVVDAGLDGLPADYLDRYPEEIGRVTAAQVREVWQRRLKTERMNVVVVGAAGKAASRHQTRNRRNTR